MSSAHPTVIGRALHVTVAIFVGAVEIAFATIVFATFLATNRRPLRTSASVDLN